VARDEDRAAFSSGPILVCDGDHIRERRTQRFRERLRQPWIAVGGTRVEAVLTALSSTA